MKKETRKDDEMPAHYNFSGGTRGKYARRYAEGTNVVVLDPDVAREFPNRDAVNKTLRAVAEIIHIQARRRDRANNKGGANKKNSSFILTLTHTVTLSRRNCSGSGTPRSVSGTGTTTSEASLKNYRLLRQAHKMNDRVSLHSWSMTFDPAATPEDLKDDELA